MEWVIIVIPPYTQIVYQLLVLTKCVPRPYHLEGRYGSRTHEYYEPLNDDDDDDNNNNNNTKESVASGANKATMALTTDCLSSSNPSITTPKRGRRMIGIPVLSKDHVYDAMKMNSELRKIFHDESLVKDDDNDHIDSNKNNDDDSDGSKPMKKQTTKNVYLMYKPYTKSKRAHEPPPFDAQIHVERRPLSFQTIESYRSMRNSYRNDTHSFEALRRLHPQKQPTFTYAELFAGIGGFGIALDALGGRCTFCSEIDELCRTVYATNLLLHDTHNIANNSIMHGDIYQVPDEALPQSGTLDLLVGGFPCQPFSSLGQQPGLDCPDGNLFLQIVRVLRISQPSAFLLENVPGLLQMTDTVNIIIQALEDCGYSVTMEICDARCLTATTRKRLYIVGLRRPQQSQPKISEATTSINTSATVPFEESFQFPYIPDLGLRAGDVIDYDLLDVEDEHLLRISDEQLNRLNTEKYWKPAHLAWPNTIIDTLVSHYGKSIARGHSQLVPGSARSLSNNSSTGSTTGSNTVSSNPRRFTPRECARLMGFPNSYILPPKTNTNQCQMAYNKDWYQMFGNAVCPPIIAAIASAVLDRCPDHVRQAQSDWIEYGRTVAVQLAYDAILLKSETYR